MKTQFVKYTDITEAAITIKKKSTGMDAHSAFLWAIYDFCGTVEFYTGGYYGEYAKFTGAPQDAYPPDTFGLCVFDSRLDFFDFWKFSALI